MKSTEISLSFGQLALAQCLASSVAAVLWFGGAFVGGFEVKIALAGPAVAGTLLAVSLVILGLFAPRKRRPIATVATLWSVASFVRFIVALLASSLLYYVAQFGLRPLLFSFLFTAVFLLVFETKTLSKMFTKNSTNSTQ